MKRLLITGAEGFVGRHYLANHDQLNDWDDVYGIDSSSGESAEGVPIYGINMLDADALDRRIVESPPTHVLHLAALSSVASSWEEPLETFQNNTAIFLTLLETLRHRGLKPRILSVGSSEEYGKVSPSDIPVKETQELWPTSPYAAARVAQDMISTVYVEGYDFDIVRTRSFNHLGPGQRAGFVISTIARQVNVVRRSGSPAPPVLLGDTTVTRDFVDVRDVVRAYHLLLQRGTKGKVYNVCSGVGRSLRDIVLEMAALVGVTVQIQTDPQRLRPVENKVMVGDPTKIQTEVNWRPMIPFKQSLHDVLQYWESDANPL